MQKNFQRNGRVESRGFFPEQGHYCRPRRGGCPVDGLALGVGRQARRDLRLPAGLGAVQTVEMASARQTMPCGQAGAAQRSRRGAGGTVARSGAGSVEVVGRLLPSVEKERHRVGKLGRWQWRRLNGQVEVVEDLPDNDRARDERDDQHGCGAPRAFQGVHVQAAAQEWDPTGAVPSRRWDRNRLCGRDEKDSDECRALSL